MNNLLIPGILATLGLVVLSKKQPVAPSFGSGTDLVPSEDIPDYQSGNVADEIYGIKRRISGVEVNYTTWKRKDWALYFKHLLANNDPQTAINILAQSWSDNRNALKPLFANTLGLVLDLVTCRDCAAIGSIIEWNSTPVYGGVYSYYNGLEIWSCADWKLWHQKLKTKYGQSQANTIWIDAWTDEQNVTPDNSWIAWLFQYGSLPGYLTSTNLYPSAGCVDDCNFVEYMHSQGVDVATVIGQTGCNLANIVVQTTGVLSNLATGAASATKLLSIAIPVGLGVYLWYWYKRQKNG